jgi:DNA-binding transcriptional MerR regulator
MKTIKWITGITLAALVALTVLLAPSYLGLAQAQTPDAGAEGQVEDGRGHGRFAFKGQGGKHGRAHIMGTVAEQLGLSPEELRASFSAGKSIADVAAEQGVALEEIENALQDKLSEHLAEKVANGDLTQEEADARLEEAKTRISEHLTQTFDGDGPGRFGGKGHGPRGHIMGTVAEQLGLSGEELRASFSAGKSIADVAAEQGVALEEIENALIDKLSEHLLDAVANGDLTQEEADARLEEAKTRISEHLNQTFDGSGPGRFGPRGEHGERGERGGPSGFATQDS